MLGNTHFKATTTYPGLILGSGNAHELPSVEGQAILGFHFDYTSGLPVIQGSSIKGVLKSAFAHPEYIQELLDDETLDVQTLESEIFDNGDIFFDAVVVSNGKILGDDFLTPHDENGLKNPIPLRFIKVLPNVSFRFDFELMSGLINQDEKAILFANILSDLGVGAKTNVGYGKFNSDLVRKVKLEMESAKEKRTKEEEEKKNQEIEKNKSKELKKLGSNFDKIQFEIKDFTKKNTKEIFDIISKYELDDDEKNKLSDALLKQIGEKPEPKNKASIKWAIKIYESLGK